MKHKAFTIWEILVVVAIVAIGAAILLPPQHRNRESALRASCASNLKQIGLAFLQYSNNYDEKAPPIANANGGWSQLMQPYLKSETIFQCPSTYGKKLGATDYFYNGRLAGTQSKLGGDAKSVSTILSGEGLDDQNASTNLSQFPAAWRTDERSPAWRHLNTANYLFVDGHAKAYPAKRIFGAPNADAATPSFEVK